MEVFILAGGKSRRMGVAKASMEIEGEPLICHVAAAAAHLGPLRIVGGSPSLVDLIAAADIVAEDVRHIPDVVEDPGPFAALVSALSEARSERALLLSCDLANLTRDDVDRLVAAQRATNADLALPLVAGRRQWHGVVVATRILQRLQQRRDDGVKSLWRGLSGHSECVLVSADRRFFFDVDTPEDVASLERQQTR